MSAANARFPSNTLLPESPAINLLWLSDSSALSDNQQIKLTLLVRFFRVIGQPTKQAYSACPILPRYRTTSKSSLLRLSDSSALSDNQQIKLTLLVRFFRVIGQPAKPNDSACPILPFYRTTSKSSLLRLSDFSTLSDNQQNKLTPLVRFFRFIGQSRIMRTSTRSLPQIWSRP